MSSEAASHPLVDRLISSSLFLYSAVRTASYDLEFRALNAASRILPIQGIPPFDVDPSTERKIGEECLALLRRDARNIQDGVYPIQVLRPESPVRHLLRIPRLLLDGASMSRRRKQGRTAVFEEKFSEKLQDLPRYYRRNFHFQTNGYLSENSAELFEHQVELLFKGAADPMRRLIIPPMKKAFSKAPDGQGLRFLEIGGGTGRATRFVKLAFPKARITVMDLSGAYLKAAERSLADLSDIDFVQGDGADLPFKNAYFDAVYSVFLYHELPLDAREAVLAESKRVLKPRGFFGFVDSLQLGDEPDFDVLLKQFPVLFHEPFYRNYTENAMERLVRKHGFEAPVSQTGFVSKLCYATASASGKARARAKASDVAKTPVGAKVSASSRRRSNAKRAEKR